MKTLQHIIFLMLLCSLFSCKKKDDSTLVDNEKIKVSLSLIHAELLETDVPLPTKSGSEETTYAIMAYEYNPNTSSYDNYAHGVFSSKNISIELTKNKKYKFAIALFKDFFKAKQQLNAYHNSDTTYYTASNKFVYNDMIFRQLHGGSSSPFRDDKGIHSKFLGETFYGSLDDYIASENNSPRIDLNRVSTLLTVKINGMTEGKIISSDMGMDFSIDFPNNTFQTWITDAKFMDGQSSFRETLLLTYVSPQNVSTRLVYEGFTFKRNFEKTIIINLTQSSSAIQQSNISINLSESSLQKDSDSVFNKNI